MVTLAHLRQSMFGASWFTCSGGTKIDCYKKSKLHQNGSFRPWWWDTLRLHVEWAWMWWCYGERCSGLSLCQLLCGKAHLFPPWRHFIHTSPSISTTNIINSVTMGNFLPQILCYSFCNHPLLPQLVPVSPRRSLEHFASTTLEPQSCSAGRHWDNFSEVHSVWHGSNQVVFLVSTSLSPPSTHSQSPSGERKGEIDWSIDNYRQLVTGCLIAWRDLC